MSAAKLRFQVDSRLATLLSQEYRSTERALKELVDNAWDADADQVSIQLPKPLSGEPIVIRDDGTGMTEEELRRHYLTIAKDPRSARGERTTGKNRQVKGRKGIGKFAGFMAASVMTLETSTRGRLCRIVLRLDAIGKVEDIEHLDIVLQSEDCDPDRHGTVITLSELHQGLAYPDPNRLQQVLLQDYGRHDDFAVFVDEKRLDVDDVQGSYSEHQTTLPDVGDVKLRLSILDGKAGLRQPGVTLRVGRSCQPQPTASKPAPAKEMASRTLAWPPEKTENREASVGAKTPTSQERRSRGQARKLRQRWGNGQKKSQPMRVGILGIGGGRWNRTTDLGVMNPTL